MATNPVQKDDIAVKGVADNLIKGLKRSKKAVDDLNKSLVELGEIHKDNIDIIKKQPDTIKKVKELNKAVKETDAITESVNNTRKESLDLDKKILAAEKKLRAANSSQIDQLTELQVQIQEQNRVNKQLVQENDKIVGAYKSQSTRLVRLRKEYKNLAVQNKENTVEAKKLLKEITQLDKKLKDVDDTVGQNQRNVGNYGKALEGLNSTLAKLGIITVLVKGFELLRDAFGDTREGTLALQITLSKFTETAKVLINNFIEAFKAAAPAVGKILSGLGTIFIQFGKLILAQFKIVNIATTALSGNLLEAKNKAAELASELAGIPKRMSEAFSKISEGAKGIPAAIDGVVKAYEDTINTTLRAIKGQEDFLKLQLKLRISIEQQEKALAGLAEKRQILQDISDDDTIGFVARAKAVEKAEEAAKQFADLEIGLAKTKEKLAIEAVKQDLRRTSTLNEAQLAQITTGEALEAALNRRVSFYRKLEKGEKDFLIARKVSDTNDETLTAAFVERRDKQVEAESFRRDQEEKFRKTARDAFEQENDIFVEFTELKIAANDKIINSDKATLKERQDALIANQKLEEDLFDNSIALILKQGRTSIDTLKKTIDLRKDLTNSEKKEEKALLDKRKALLSSAAIQEILNEQDIKKQKVLIRNIDLGEIEEKVLKDTLKLRKSITDANKESLKVEEDTTQRTKELQLDVATQRAFLAGEDIDLEKAQTQNQIDQLEERIHNAKEGSIEMLELQKELNDLLIDEEKKRIEEEDRLRIEQINKAQALANQVADEFAKIIKERNRQSLELADAEKPKSQ